MRVDSKTCAARSGRWVTMNTPYIKETQQSNISELALASSWLGRVSALEYPLFTRYYFT